MFDTLASPFVSPSRVRARAHLPRLPGIASSVTLNPVPRLTQSDPLASCFSTHPYPSSLFSPHSHSHSQSHSPSQIGDRAATSFPNVHVNATPLPELPFATTDFPGLSLPFYTRSADEPDARGTFGTGVVGFSGDINGTNHTHAANANTNTTGATPALVHGEGGEHDAVNRSVQAVDSSPLRTPLLFRRTGTGTGTGRTGTGLGIGTGSPSANGIGTRSEDGSIPAHSGLGHLDLDDADDVRGKKQKRAQVRVACTHCQKACKKCSNTR
jgi:hypothetical protein